MRIIVCGGRDYANLQRVAQVLGEYMPDDPHADEPTIVHGGARGADGLAADVAVGLGLPTEAHPADWRKYSKAAGPIRNEEMAGLGADLCIAFPGGNGTADMVKRARKHGIPVRHVSP